MMLCKADFEELFPHIFEPEKHPSQDQPREEEPVPSIPAVASAPSPIIYAPMWAMLSGYGALAEAAKHAKAPLSARV